MAEGFRRKACVFSFFDNDDPCCVCIMDWKQNKAESPATFEFCDYDGFCGARCLNLLGNRKLYLWICSGCSTRVDHMAFVPRLASNIWYVMAQESLLSRYEVLRVL
jgi:hypothetical protein